MKKISRKNLPAYLPFNLTAITYLLLDKFHAAGWVYGVAYTLLALIWIGALTSIAKEESVDILNGKSSDGSKWAQKLREMQNKQN